MTLNHGFTMRPATMADLEAVVALLNACSMKIIGKADESVEAVRADWQMPGFDQVSSQRVIVSPQNQIVGFAEVRNDPRPTYPFLDVYVHPDFEEAGPFLDVYVHPDFEEAGIAAPLVEWGEERAREAIAMAPADVRVAMQAAGYAQDQHYKQVLESVGMKYIRYQWRMGIDLNDSIPAPVWPAGITVRTMIPGQDERKVLEVQRAAFRDHWGYVERPFEEHFESWWHTWTSEGDFDPSLWFLAMDGETIAGISLCKDHAPGDAESGWVSTLGVTRAYRQRGLGMALLLHSFHVMLDLGKERAALGVDANSLTGATRLYQKAGMSVTTQFDIFEKELRPGRDLAIRG